MGYSMVTFGTPGLSPKLKCFTRSTILLTNVSEARSVDSLLQNDTLPSGSMVMRNTSLPCKVPVPTLGPVPWSYVYP